MTNLETRRYYEKNSLDIKYHYSLWDRYRYVLIRYVSLHISLPFLHLLYTITHITLIYSACVLYINHDIFIRGIICRQIM